MSGKKLLPHTRRDEQSCACIITIDHLQNCTPLLCQCSDWVELLARSSKGYIYGFNARVRIILIRNVLYGYPHGVRIGIDQVKRSGHLVIKDFLGFVRYGLFGRSSWRRACVLIDTLHSTR